MYYLTSYDMSKFNLYRDWNIQQKDKMNVIVGNNYELF